MPNTMLISPTPIIEHRTLRFKRVGCAHRATVYTRLGRGAVVAPTTSAAPRTGPWTVAVNGKRLAGTYPTQRAAFAAARAEFARQMAAGTTE